MVVSAAVWASSGGPLWDWLSGASPTGPRWLALLLGIAALAIIAVGIVVALWPTGRFK